MKKPHLVSTATLTSQLLKRGFRNTFIAGPLPLWPDLRLVSYAFTLRYVPAREDVGFHVDYDNTKNIQRLAVEAIGPGTCSSSMPAAECGSSQFLLTRPQLGKHAVECLHSGPELKLSGRCLNDIIKDSRFYVLMGPFLVLPNQVDKLRV